MEVEKQAINLKFFPNYNKGIQCKRYQLMDSVLLWIIRFIYSLLFIIYQKMLEESVEQFSLVLMGIIILIIMYAYIGTLFQHKQIHIIHETGVGIIIGFIFGLIMYFFKGLDDYDFNQEIFFYALLPPMIFSGGYNLKKRRFFQNFSYISLFGALGTITAFGIIFGLTYLINQLGWIRQWSDIDKKVTLSLTLIIKYSATICASDSVAALTMIKPNKYPKLFSIIFGEGMINDAVAIILFKVVGDIFDNGGSDQNAAFVVFGILWKFVVNVLCSLLIGGACALACSKLFQISRFLAHNPVIEVTTLYLFGILSYVIAEVLQMSGVITVLVCGICLAHFNFYNLSITGQIATGVTFQTVSFMAQAFVFIYLGLSTMFYVNKETFSYTFILLQLLICAFARFVAIFGLTLIFKLCKKKWQVTFYQLLIVTVAGIIRGSVAFALILTLQSGEVGTSVVKSSVLLMVFITTIFLGAIMPGFITGCLKKDAKNQNLDQIQVPILEFKKKEQEPKGFKKFDEGFLKPFFIYDYVNRKKQIKEFKRLLKLNSPDYKGGEYMGLLVVNSRQTLSGVLVEEDKKSSIVTDQ